MPSQVKVGRAITAARLVAPDPVAERHAWVALLARAEQDFLCAWSLMRPLEVRDLTPGQALRDDERDANRVRWCDGSRAAFNRMVEARQTLSTVKLVCRTLADPVVTPNVRLTFGRFVAWTFQPYLPDGLA